MKVSAFLSAALCGVGLLLALNAASVECTRHTWHAPQTMFVFGDSFVDNGNLPQTDLTFELSRQWKYPYGISYKNDDGSGPHQNATGRFSDFMVQSDFVAKMLGLPQSPPAYRIMENLYCDPSGLNFAFGGAGVLRLPGEMITVGEQVDYFENMIKGGTISKNRVTHSIALLAVSGTDYKRFNVSGLNDVTACIEEETTGIVAITERLRNLGVKKILVNNLHPLGCTPFWSRTTRYQQCDDFGNGIASVHNRKLKKKLGKKKGVFIVDLHTAFGNIISHPGSKLKFNDVRKPCCEGYSPKYYCGEEFDTAGTVYLLCDDRRKRFFWDDDHPTHAGWEVVMKQLENPIKEFLGVV